MPELFMPTPVAPSTTHRCSSRLPTPTDAHCHGGNWNTSEILQQQSLQPQAPAPSPQDDEDFHESRANGRVEAERNLNVPRNGKLRYGGSKQKPQWKKLLWVKQDYPDNWVDPTFLKDLQRNINVHPYDFYSLVAESTVVVQHLASVVIFVTCFVAIYIQLVSPVSVVVVSTALTVAGWAVWDMNWEKREAATERAVAAFRDGGYEAAINNNGSGAAGSPSPTKGLGLDLPTNGTMPRMNRDSYFPPLEGGLSPTPATTSKSSQASDGASQPQYQDHSKHHRRSRVLSTAKSALLIYFTLLGLSPILRSLTKGVTEDSIWAIATWLFIANFLGFDYGSGIERKFPASFSTNAAITSSVVLASRLTDTSHVFSLILFSIQVFGLFPVFRRTLKHISWNLHVLLTVVLVLGDRKSVV